MASYDVASNLFQALGTGLGAAHMGPDGDGNTPAEMARLEGHAELSDWLRCHVSP